MQVPEHLTHLANHWNHMLCILSLKDAVSWPEETNTDWGRFGREREVLSHREGSRFLAGSIALARGYFRSPHPGCHSGLRAGICDPQQLGGPQGIVPSALGNWIRDGPRVHPSSGSGILSDCPPDMLQLCQSWVAGHCWALPQDAAGWVHPSMTSAGEKDKGEERKSVPPSSPQLPTTFFLIEGHLGEWICFPDRGPLPSLLQLYFPHFSLLPFLPTQGCPGTLPGPHCWGQQTALLPDSVKTQHCCGFFGFPLLLIPFLLPFCPPLPEGGEMGDLFLNYAFWCIKVAGRLWWGSLSSWCGGAVPAVQDWGRP